MDYPMFYNYFIKCIKNKVTEEYGVELNEDTELYIFPSEEGDVELSFVGGNMYLFNNSLGNLETYTFMSKPWEIVTYCSFKNTDEGLRILHQRVLQGPNDHFVIISSAAEISGSIDYLSSEDLSSWPNNLVSPTYEETLFRLCKKSHFSLDKELSCIIKMDVAPEDLHAQMCNEQSDLLELLKETSRG